MLSLRCDAELKDVAWYRVFPIQEVGKQGSAGEVGVFFNTMRLATKEEDEERLRTHLEVADDRTFSSKSHHAGAVKTCVHTPTTRPDWQEVAIMKQSGRVRLSTLCSLSVHDSGLLGQPYLHMSPMSGG